MSDVVDLKAFKKKKTEPTDETLEDAETTSETKEVEKAEKSEVSFDELMRRNEENRLRMKKDREKANKGVIRSYRLKDRK